MSEDSPLYSARVIIERAFRGTFDREPLTDKEIALIASAAEKWSPGDIPEWKDTPEGPSLTIRPDTEHPDDLKWILAKEAVCRLGYSQREAADKYGLSYDNLRQRCVREEWPVPSRVKEVVSQVSLNRAVAQLEGETWAERAEKSKKLAWAITERPLNALIETPERAPKVQNWSDIATIVKLNRQAAGLDTAETQVNASFNFAMLGQAIPDAIPGEFVVGEAEGATEKGDLPE